MFKKDNRQKFSGGKIIVKSLEIENVKYVFGLIGSATMEIFDALYKNKKIRYIGVRDERTGTHIADGYARASGNAGIIIAGQNGPGATNLTTGLAQAYKAHSAVISLAGDIANDHKGKDTFQEIDQHSLFEPITKKTFSIKKTSSISKTISEAFKISLSGRMGPVHINLPRDILSKRIIFNELKKHEKIKSKTIHKSKILEIISVLSNSKKPVIIAGGGIKNSESSKEVIKLAKKINCPIVSSAGHGDVISFNEKLYAGQMGPRGNKVASDLVRNADVILALGTRLGFNSTFFSYENINKYSKIIQIDIEKNAIAKYFKIEIGVCGDVKDIIKKLNNIIIKKKFNKVSSLWTKNLIEKRKEYLKQRDINLSKKNFPIQPSDLFKCLRDVLPSSAAITLDAGTLCLQATDMFKFKNNKSLFTPLDFGLVGFSFACGLGVKLAKPKTPVISLMGDGGFGMTISELSTAVEYKINTVTIVMNNGSWGAEKAYQRDFYNKRYIGSDISSPPFHKLAELYGAKGFYVDKISDIKKTVKKALKLNKPSVINIMVDPKALYSFRRDSFKHRILKNK